MGSLNSLKLSAVKRPSHMPPVQKRRNKLASRLHEQIQLAQAQQAGTLYAPVRYRSYTDPATGLRKQVEAPKRVKPWWFTSESGKLALCVRFGPRVLELAKGKFAVEVPAHQELVPTLELIKSAVLAGELDTEIEAAAGKVREAFGK